MCPQLVPSRDAPTILEPPVVPVDAAVSLTSPLCKETDICEVDSEGNQSILQPLKESQTIGSDISDVSSHPSPDVEEVEEAIASLSSPIGQPGLKPENPETLTGLPAKSPCGEQGRRRSSHPWKGFSLKKQLSRVDQKFKHTFSAASQPTNAPCSTSHSKEKRSSVFYYSSSDMPCTSFVVSPIETESPPPEPSEENECKEVGTPDCTESQPQNEFTVCGTMGSNDDIQEQEHGEEHARQESTCAQVSLNPAVESKSENSETGEYISHAEPASPMQDDGKEIEESVISKKVNRPVDLPLFDTDGKPLRPPRRESKKKSLDKREGRLLSVPNIKCSRPDHLLRDLRSKEDASSNQPSFGNLMRRLSKCAFSCFHCYTCPFCSLALKQAEST